MRLIKIFGLAALTTAVAAGIIGVSSASANTWTQLCNVHTSLVCPPGQGTTEDHQVLADNTSWKLLSSLATILCLYALKRSTPLALGNPQLVHTLELVVSECGTNSTHTNCEVEVEELPLLELLKVGLDEGSLTSTNGQIRVICENIFGFIDIDCKFNLTGMLLAMNSQHSTANQTPLTAVGDKALCPNEPRLDLLLVTLTKHYILQ